MSGDVSWLSGLFSTVWGLAFVALLLGGSIFVHELGHFLAARWRGLKVDRFSIGFDPKIVSWKGRDGVDYQIGWIPLGGYVALPQLANPRALEGEPSAVAMDLPPVKYIDKMITVVAGVVFNLLFALVLSIILWVVGVPWPSASDTQVVGYVFPTMEALREGVPAYELPPGHIQRDFPADPAPAPAAAAGIKPGDRILAVDGRPIANFRDLPEAIALSSGRDDTGHPQVTITYERNGVKQDVKVFPALVPTNSRTGDTIREIGLMPAEKMIIGRMNDGSPAQAAGLHEGDEILAVNGQPVYCTAQLNDDFISKSNGPALVFTVNRNGQNVNVPVQPTPVPVTTPLATVTVNRGAVVATLDILPIYKVDATGNLALPATPAQKLLVWNVDNRGGAFGQMRSGDYLLRVNNREVGSVQQVIDTLQATPAGQAPSLVFDSESAHETATISLPPDFAAAVTPSATITRIGISGWKDDSPPEHPTPPAQFAHAFGQIFGMLGALFNRHSDIGIQHLTGPIGMSRMIYEFSEVDVRMALWFAFIINVNLAILNLLPIPVLDGGHILFFTIARLRRRELPQALISTAQAVCVVLIMSLALYVVINDSRRWSGESDLEAKARHDSYYYLDQENMKFPAPPAPPSTTTAPGQQ